MKYGITTLLENTVSLVYYGTLKQLIQKNKKMLTFEDIHEEDVKDIDSLVDVFNKVALDKRPHIQETIFTVNVTFRVSTEDDIKYAKEHDCFVDYSLKDFEENKKVYYIKYCYHKDETYPIPDVFCYCWHENLRKCFNEELLFADKEDAIAKCNELKNALLYKVN